VNPIHLVDNPAQVLALTLLIVVGNALIGSLIAFVFPYPARTALVIGAGLSQIGEFSFILGRTGIDLRLLSQEQYSLILAGSVLSITLNPLLFRAVPRVEAFLQRFPNSGDASTAKAQTFRL
jgi:CPA2 family monovalent cation:H+ antiporter-2